MSDTGDLLIGLSTDELEALADSRLAPTAQGRLDELLARNKAKQLSPDEENELNRLLQQVDHLTVLKTRASFTLNQHRAEAAGT